MLSHVMRRVAVTARAASTVVRPATVSRTAVGIGCISTGVATAAFSAQAAGYKANKNVVVLESKALRQLFTVIRDKDTKTREYVFAADRLMTILAEEGLSELPSTPTDVQTPCGVYEGLVGPASDNICVVSVVRAGDSLAQVVRKLVPDCAIGKILIQRDESDPEKRPILMYSKLPPRVKSMHVMLVDPMVATGGSACKAIQVLIDAGVPADKIMFLNVVACPEGLARLQQEFPKLKIVTAAVDEKLNDDKYIVPGLGDAGDRYFNTND